MIATRVMHLDGTGRTVLDNNSPGNKKLVECGCNAHARRYLVKALDAGDNKRGAAARCVQEAV